MIQSIASRCSSKVYTDASTNTGHPPNLYTPRRDIILINTILAKSKGKFSSRLFAIEERETERVGKRGNLSAAKQTIWPNKDGAATIISLVVFVLILLIYKLCLER